MNSIPGPAGKPERSPDLLAGAGPEGAGAGSACPAPALPAVAERSEAEPAKFNAIPVRAMEDVMAKRAEQIRKYGHTVDADAKLPLRHFTQQLRRGVVAIEEDVQFRVDCDLLRARVVRHAALCLALIDRLDVANESKDHG